MSGYPKTRIWRQHMDSLFCRSHSNRPRSSTVYEKCCREFRRNPNPTTFREPIANVSITIDSDRLAYLRADFQVVRDGQAQSKGVDEFTLVREGGTWRLAVIAYTSLPAK